MFALKCRKDMGLLRFPGRIPFIQHLWCCLRPYYVVDYEMDWEVTNKVEKIEVIEWGHYNEELQEWIYL